MKKMSHVFDKVEKAKLGAKAGAKADQRGCECGASCKCDACKKGGK